MTSLLWFRRDLRLQDLPPILDAARDGQDVLACYVLDPRLRASGGPRRLRYLYDALRELRDGLDGHLLVTEGRPDVRIPALVKEIDASAVYVSADYTPFGVRRDTAVREALGDVPLEDSGSPYLVSPGRVTKGDGTPYKVFTPFYRAWREHGWRGPAQTSAASARWLDPAALDATAAGAVDIPTIDADLEHPAGEAAAHEGWQQFLATSVSDYSAERNRPDHDGTSRMSAHLKFGTIHPRTMAADLTGGEGAQTYLRELAFRDFYASVLHAWPRSAWWNFNENFDRIEVDEDDDARERFEVWKAGRTGFPIVDAGMRQLSETGFMHNRVRMISASFLVKDLHLPWQWGARWFLEQLTDGDMANNNHGWQWAAGCGTDAAPYFRVFNPTTQGDKFDPDGAYVKRWVPEFGGGDYPKPIIDHAAERLEALRRYEAVR